MTILGTKLLGQDTDELEDLEINKVKIKKTKTVGYNISIQS